MRRFVPIACVMVGTGLLNASEAGGAGPVGEISGAVRFCDQPTAAVVYLDGHSYVAKTSDGFYVLHDVPRGDYQLVVEIPQGPTQDFNITLAGRSLAFDPVVPCPPGGQDDADQDGYTVAGGDCDDGDASINPGASEICSDGIDNDCDGQVDESCSIECDDANECTIDLFDSQTQACAFILVPDGTSCAGGSCLAGQCTAQDFDQDGFTAADGDCDDGDASINPGALEICSDGIDNDCDGQVDEEDCGTP